MFRFEKNYNSYKFVFFVFKWVIIEKFLDYFIGKIFFVYIDNNLLIYILIFVKCGVNGYIEVDVLLRLLYIFIICMDIVKVNCDLD